MVSAFLKHSGFAPSRRVNGKGAKLTSSLLAGLLLLTFLLPGCSAKRTATAESFTQAAEDNGFTVTDTTSSYSTYSSLQTYLTAKDENGCSVYFLEFGSAKDSLSFYHSTLDGWDLSSASVNTVDSSAFNKVSMEGGGSFGVLIRMETITIYASGSTDNRGPADALLKALGY